MFEFFSFVTDKEDEENTLSANDRLMVLIQHDIAAYIRGSEILIINAMSEIIFLVDNRIAKEIRKMKKYRLSKVDQKGKTFYALVADPRIIVELLTEYKAGEEQETQRPWIEKRVKEIAKYVAGKFKDDENKKAQGLIPNAPILNIKNKLQIDTDEDGYYILLPSDKNEFAEYKECIEAIDGQHRIRAFMKEYRDIDFSDDIKYEMIFSLFDRLSKSEKQEIFMITNEKQVKVPNNLLRMFKRELDLLKGDEQIYDLTVMLNEEDYSPLKGRIMLGAKKISKGYQESQISKIIRNSDSYNQLVAITGGDKNKMAKMISNYLKAWEKSYDISFQEPGKDTAAKISGIRYMMYLMPCILDIIRNKRVVGNTDEFKKIVDLLPGATMVEDVFNDSATTLSFRGEGATIQLAKDHATLLKNYDASSSDEFDMTAGI